MSTTPDMNALIRAATGRGQTAETEPDTEPDTTNDETSSNAEPEPELTMNDLIRRASGRHYQQPDEQPNETTKPSASQLFSDRIRADLRSRRGLLVSAPSDNETEEIS
jgi:hypothetical protein